MQHRGCGCSPPSSDRWEEGAGLAELEVKLVLWVSGCQTAGVIGSGAFFLLRFSFIVITKYIPMMENYGFLLATWQLCLYLFFSFWCILNPVRLQWGGIMRL